MSQGTNMFLKTLEEFLKVVSKAEKGDAEYQFKLGVCYKNGQGVPQDYKLAVEWYQKAAEQNHASAQCHLGFCYYYGLGVPLDYKLAVKWFQKAAEQGNIDAQSELGYCYDMGLGVQQDYSQAVEWYQKAAKQGDDSAQNNLGVCYKKGQGVPQDCKLAAEWYQKAAEQGNSTAQFNLGCCYEDGQGVPQNTEMALEWFQKAADQGYDAAKLKLKDYYSQNDKKEMENKNELEAKTKRAEKLLSDFLGEVPFKYSQEFAEYLRETVAIVPTLQKMSAFESFWSQTLLVSIDDGYGMQTFLDALWQLFSAFGIAADGNNKKPYSIEKIVEVGPSHDIYYDWNNVVEMAETMNLENSQSPSKFPILCLNLSLWQNKLNSVETKKYLRKLNELSTNFIIVFKIPFMETRSINAISESLSDLFNIRSIVVPPTSMEDLLNYAKVQLAKRGFTLAEDTKSTIEKMIIQEKRDASFFGYETVDKLVDRIIIEKAKYNSIFHKIEHDISRSDIASCVLEDNSVEADPNEELKELIGLESVKKTINEIISQIKIHKSMSKDRKRRVKRPALHMMFTGNPGTGKTTVARIVAELFHKEGILSKGHLIEVKGRDLCAEYIGQTAPKTSGYCRDAYGSVLFIDEAYTLFTGDKDFKRDFGYEALATLVAEMENHRNDLCVILAGYTDEMKTMLKGNPGMESRIPYTVEFPNYSREELFKIFFMMVKGSGFKYEKKLESAVRNFFKKIPDAVLSSKDFSNARFVRNLFERTWGKAACRCSLSKEDIMLLASDLLSAADEGEFKQLMESKPRKSIGFGS